MTINFKLQCEKFMYIYMYELEKVLKNNIKELKSISFHADEANLDKSLKEFMKKFVRNSPYFTFT